jgi:hypothetical protein
MSRSLLSLRTAVRQRAGMEHDQFVADDELSDYINQSAGELHDLLVAKYEDYYTTFTTFTLTAANNIQILPNDFLKLRRLQFNDAAGPNPWRQVPQFSMEDMERTNSTYRAAFAYGPYRAYRIFQNGIWMSPEDDASGTYRMFYVQRFIPMVLDTDEMADWQGWSEYVIVDATIKCLNKEESEIGPLMAAKAALLQRIEWASANRNAAEPQHFEDVTRSRTREYDDWYPR